MPPTYALRRDSILFIILRPTSQLLTQRLAEFSARRLAEQPVRQLLCPPLGGELLPFRGQRRSSPQREERLLYTVPER
jgi:hypothetical protein